jgi:hypothetical protein
VMGHDEEAGTARAGRGEGRRGNGSRRGGKHGEGRAGAAMGHGEGRRGDGARRGGGHGDGRARRSDGARRGGGHDKGSAGSVARRACVWAARRGRAGGAARGVQAARRRGDGAACGGAVIQNSEMSEREVAGARPGRFRASIFVGLTEADENSGRSMTYFRRYGPGPRKYSTFLSVTRSTKITSIFSWACRRK